MQQTFSHGMQEALAIWLALLAAVIITFLILTAISRRGAGGPSWWSRLRKAVRDPEAVRERQAKVERTAKELLELQRYCAEVAVAAERTTVMADRRRAEWEGAQRTQEAAWRAYEEAERDVHRLRRANAFPLTDDDPQIRRRHLVRLVNAAHDRGEISAADLADALMHRNGWDHGRPPVRPAAHAAPGHPGPEVPRVPGGVGDRTPDREGRRPGRRREAQPRRRGLRRGPPPAPRHDGRPGALVPVVPDRPRPLLTHLPSILYPWGRVSGS
jgi:hypothetical protein